MLGESLRERFGERPEVPIRQEAIKLLASDTRLNILKHLQKRRMTVSELARVLTLNKSTVHEHLAKLVEGGLIKRDESEEREFVYYELTRTAHYVLQPSSARFVLMMGTVVIAGLLGLVLLHIALTANQGLALAVADPIVPAGEANVWAVDVARPGLLGFREPATDARLFLLSPEELADYQLSGHLPADARTVGAADGLVRSRGHYEFRAALDAGVHYLVATADGVPHGVFPLRAQAVEVKPAKADLLHGVDPSRVDLAVSFRGAPVVSGLVSAVTADGRELAQVPVLNGRAVVDIAEPADKVAFRFKPAEQGSAFAPAEGQVRAVAPRVAFEPALVPTGVRIDVRVVVDDPVAGPRRDAPVTLVRADGAPLAQARTDGTGSGNLGVRLREPGEFILKAGDLEVGRVVAKPGLRLWIEPGPHWEGERLRVRSLQLGNEPAPVSAVSVLLDGREVGATDADGWLTLQFGLGGEYTLEARRDGHVPATVVVDVLPRTGYVLPHLPRAGLAPWGAPAASEPARVEVSADQVLVGQAVQVRALLHNDDTLPRIVRAELREDGKAVAARGVEVPAAGSAWVVFEYTPVVAGTHQLQVNDLPARVLEATPAQAPMDTADYAALPFPGETLLLPALALAALALGRRRA